MRSPKKAFWLVLCAIAIMVFALAACSPAATEEPVEVGPAPAATEEVAQPEEPAEPAASEDVFTIGLMTVGPWDDHGWSQLHHEACVKLEEHYAGRVECVGVENVPYGEEATQTAELLISQGADFIIDGVSAAAFVDPVIEAHPEVKFISVAGTFLDSPPNYEVYFWNSGAAEWLLGMAAGMLTETNQISYIAPFDFPNIHMQILTYHLAARAVNPDVTTHVVVLNSWYDPAGARQATETLADAGIDVIGGDMDDPTKVAVAEERGIWGLGAYTDAQREFGPTTYVNAYVYDFYAMWLPIVDGVLNGTEWVGNGELVFYPFGAGIDIGVWGENVPQDVIDAVEAERQKLLDGYDPYVGPLVDVDGNVILAEGQHFTPEDYLYGTSAIVDGMVIGE
jgi:basic membrane lipoprotein Med (substrate-binding protein (PBP1-ABC) superfamily)